MNDRSCMIKFDEELDVRGLNCPLPLLRTKKMLSQMKPGEVLKVLTTDPAAEIDFRVFDEETIDDAKFNVDRGEPYGKVFIH